MTRKKPTRGRQPLALEVQATPSRQELEEHIAHHERVNFTRQCLFAYSRDKDPVHLLRAVRRVAQDGLPLPAAVLGYLDRAIREIESPPKKSGKPVPRGAAREARIIQELQKRYAGSIPARIPMDLKEDIAKREGISKDALGMLISRYRRAVGKPARRDNRT